MTSNNPIGFFDSGVGQLSILKEAKKLLPTESFVVYADQLNNPLGAKTEEQIKKFVLQACSFLVKKHNIKLMVIACNSASVFGLDYLRSNLEIPVVGTVPAVKKAGRITKTQRVVIMSTPATAKSPYLDELIKNYAKWCKVLKIGCAGLEEAIETLDKKEIAINLKKYIAKVKMFKPDVVVLGCTHYPLIKDEIKKELDPTVTVIDSGTAIAKRAKRLIDEGDLFSPQQLEDIYYTTGDTEIFSQVATILMGEKIVAKKPIN